MNLYQVILTTVWKGYGWTIEPYITPEQPSTPNVDVKIEFTLNVHALKPVQVFSYLMCTSSSFIKC